MFEHTRFHYGRDASGLYNHIPINYKTKKKVFAINWYDSYNITAYIDFVSKIPYYLSLNESSYNRAQETNKTSDVNVVHDAICCLGVYDFNVSETINLSIIIQIQFLNLISRVILHIYHVVV